MQSIRYTLLTDGSSDKALLPILDWVLKSAGITMLTQPQWADFTHLRRPKGLPERIQWAVEYYPCDLLFVHRDAERDPHGFRVAEIRAAVQEVIADKPGSVPPHVCVVPVRMQEAWLLFDEAAIREAAGNPNGREQLKLPSLAEVEGLPNPKTLLDEILREASGLGARRRSRLDMPLLRSRVVDFIHDFSPLHGLSAFQALEAEVQQVLRAAAWNT